VRDLPTDQRSVSEVVRRLRDHDLGAEHSPVAIGDLLLSVQTARLEAERRVREYENLVDCRRTGGSERASYVRGFNEALDAVQKKIHPKVSHLIDAIRADFVRASTVAVEERRAQDRADARARAMQGVGANLVE
jgi:hypothetical protein